MDSHYDIDDFNYDIGERLKELRAESGISQYELSRLSNVSRSRIAAVETQSSDVSIKVLFKLMRGLEVSPKEFFDTFKN